ncbi:hypothetical protein JTE90_019864 [Oedothorax gibbosus]|uniref:Uncharacterized protein n=1 Tax=Oedothorax gibbosus TaxID=931172 RepID=A0AAV6VX41_9ARAC|nr:hypothetical protein JTE90_019864 [Oedothorax gibbosus]
MNSKEQVENTGLFMSYPSLPVDLDPAFQHEGAPRRGNVTLGKSFGIKVAFLTMIYWGWQGSAFVNNISFFLVASDPHRGAFFSV